MSCNNFSRNRNDPSVNKGYGESMERSKVSKRPSFESLREKFEVRNTK